jgi:hypothetical protein
MSFKPENLHPLAGLAIPTMIEVLLDKTKEQIEIFMLFGKTHNHLITLSMITGGMTGASLARAVFDPSTPKVAVFLVLIVLSLSVWLCDYRIVNLKWRAFDRGKAYHETLDRVGREYYGDKWQEWLEDGEIKEVNT